MPSPISALYGFTDWKHAFEKNILFFCFAFTDRMRFCRFVLRFFNKECFCVKVYFFVTFSPGKFDIPNWEFRKLRTVDGFYLCELRTKDFTDISCRGISNQSYNLFNDFSLALAQKLLFSHNFSTTNLAFLFGEDTVSTECTSFFEKLRKLHPLRFCLGLFKADEKDFFRKYGLKDLLTICNSLGRTTIKSIYAYRCEVYSHLKKVENEDEPI